LPSYLLIQMCEILFKSWDLYNPNVYEAPSLYNEETGLILQVSTYLSAGLFLFFRSVLRLFLFLFLLWQLVLQHVRLYAF
jgi:hypothetical protein